MSGDYPAQFFKDKIVLLDVTAVGMGDVLSTPVSALSQPTPGVEFHANAIEAIRQSGLIVKIVSWLTCLFCALLEVLPLLWLPKLAPLKSLSATILYYFVVTLIAVAIPRLLNIWMPPTGALVAVLLAYPIWSWRKLDSAQIFLDIELKNEREDLSKMGINPAALSLDTDQDPLQ